MMIVLLSENKLQRTNLFYETLLLQGVGNGGGAMRNPYTRDLNPGLAHRTPNELPTEFAVSKAKILILEAAAREAGWTWSSGILRI